MTARGQLRVVVTVRDALSQIVAIENAALFVRRTGTMTAPVMHADPTTAAVLGNPRISNDQAEVVVWLDETEPSWVVDVEVTDNGGLAYRAGHPANTVSFPAYTEQLEVS